MSQLRNIVITQQKTIPARFIKAAYIEMPNGSYINTGILAVDNTSVEVSFSKNWETLGSGRCYIFWQGEGDYGGVRYYNDNATVLRGGYGAQTWGNAPSQSIPEPSTLYFAKSNYKLNGTSFSGFNLGANFSGNYIIGNDHTDITQLPVRIWGFKIWDASANLVFNAIPVYDTLTKEAGMYDKVSGTFFDNDGTGTIKAYDENNNLISDYTILDHCYFSASPVITDIKPKSTWTDLKLSIMPKSSSSNPYALCARTSSSSTDKLEIRTYFTTSKFNVVIGANSTVYPSVQDLTAKSDIDIDGTDIKVTNSGVTTTTSVGSTPGFVNCDYPICIGGLKDGNTMSSSYKMTGYFYGMQVYDNNALAHNIVPAKNYLNEVCLYNTVTKKAYYPVSGTLLEDAPLVDDGIFKFTIDLQYNPTRNCYLTISGASDYTIDWGDGTTVQTGQSMHTYSSTGQYQIKITKGNNFPNVKLTNLAEVISIDTPLPYMNNVTTFDSFATNCSHLNSVNENLFYFNPQLTSIKSCFLGCTSISTLPDKLLEPLINVEFMVSLFEGATSLTSIPTGFFDKCTSLTRLSKSFKNCTNLETIPDFLFDKNVLVYDFTQCFMNCNAVTIPQNLFCNDSTDKTTRFANVSGMDFDSCFYRTSYTGSATTTVPALWDYTYTETPGRWGCYGGAGNNSNNITNYSSIPNPWNAS